MLIISGILYIVGTPIGNLGDISTNIKNTLSNVDFVAAEDTRVTLTLLNALNIKNKLVSYHEHNKLTSGKTIVNKIKAGESCALVSDAGMPCISDPGKDLVNLCLENDILVRVVPGPNAAISALAISGISGERFYFEGFLSVNKNSRRERLEEIASLKHTIILYEAPHKLLATLEDLKQSLGERKIAIAHEMTKIHESVFRGDFASAIDYYSNTAIKGEFVIIIEGLSKSANKDDLAFNKALEQARELINSGLSLPIASKVIAKLTNQKKSDIYKGLLADKVDS